MVTSVQEADEIAAAAENSGVNVMAAQGYRFLHAAGFIRERLVAGDIGELQGVKVRFRRYVPDVLSNPEHSLYALRQHGIAFPDLLLTHVSPIGWEHINLTGDYTWHPNRRVSQGRFRPPTPRFSWLCLLVLPDNRSGNHCRHSARTR
jgi:hypothetical protein